MWVDGPGGVGSVPAVTRTFNRNMSADLMRFVEQQVRSSGGGALLRNRDLRFLFSAPKQWRVASARMEAVLVPPRRCGAGKRVASVFLSHVYGPAEP